jgi:hypothetical protein
MYDILMLIFAILQKIILFKFSRSYLFPAKTNKKTVILTNGPSLKKDMKKILSKKDELEIYVVNFFALNKDFNVIKPKFYVVSDDAFWRTDVNKDLKKKGKKLYKSFSKVNWEMCILCPSVGAKSILKRLKKNKYIKVKPIKSCVYHFKTEKINIFSLCNTITTPIFINVLILSLWHAMQRKIKKIEIYGADFSGFKGYAVNQYTNELYTSVPHFYKKTKADSYTGLKYPGRPKPKIHWRFYQWSTSFYQMYLLSMVAKKKNIKVINCSSNSYLDSFDRPKYVKK